MQVQMDKGAATKRNQGEIHEFVFAEIRGDDGFYTQHEAASLTDLRRALANAGKSNDFHSYCAFEEMLRNGHRQQLAELDSDGSFVDDANESGEYKREYAKYLLGRDLRETLFIGREELVALCLNNALTEAHRD